MRTLIRILLVVCLTIPAFFLVNSSFIVTNHKFREAHAVPSTAMQPADASGPSRAPRYVVVRMKTPLETLVAGESGIFKLEARMQEPEGSTGRLPRWNRTAAAPLVVWIASPQNSGIEFIDKVHVAKTSPRHGRLHTFQARATHPAGTFPGRSTAASRACWRPTIAPWS